MSSLYVVIYYYHLELKVKSGHCTLQIPKINFYFPLTSQFICEEGRNLKLKMKKKNHFVFPWMAWEKKWEIRLTLNTLVNYNLNYNMLKRTESLKVSCKVVSTEQEAVASQLRSHCVSRHISWGWIWDTEEPMLFRNAPCAFQLFS